jgi:hypothetical protein
MKKRTLSDDLDELRASLRIDPNDIDQALEEQAEIFDRVAEAYEIACSQRDLAEAELKEVDAELMQQVRKRINKEESSKKKADKTTDTAIKEEVYLMPAVKQARLRLIDAKLTAGRWKALKEAFEQRSYMITGVTNRQTRQQNYNDQRDGRYGPRSRIAEAAMSNISETRRASFRDLRDRKSNA